jgi:Zn-dependent protease
MNEFLQIFAFLVLIFSIVIHEFSHGWMADQLGDPTARYMGRLTLNPIAHIDLWGSIIVPLFLFLTNAGFIIGWAKPVPYNPYNLRDQKRGPAMVALAGPGANLLIASIFGILIRVLTAYDPIAYADTVNLFIVIVSYNILLAIFNLVPLPPLDGSKILDYFLPPSLHSVMETLEKNYFLFLIIFILFGFQLILPIIYFLFGVITGISPQLLM